MWYLYLSLAPARLRAFLSLPESVKELEVGWKRVVPAITRPFSLGFGLGAASTLPGESPKLGQVCTWKGNASSGHQLGDDAMDVCWQERWPCAPAGLWLVWSRPPEMSCPSSCWLTSSLAGGLLGRATGQGDMLGLRMVAVCRAPTVYKHLRPPNNPE